MAKKPEYTRFTVYSKYDPATKEYDIPSYNKDIRNIINNAVKSALPEGAFFQVGEKDLSKSGRGRWDIYVHTEDKNVLRKSLGTIESELTFNGNGDRKYHITRAIPVDRRLARELRREESDSDGYVNSSSVGGSGSRSYTSSEDSAEGRSSKWLFIKAIALLTTISNITRRILSSVLTFSQQTAQDMITAHNLGMSYASVRDYRHLEGTHGLKEGTVTGAVADIQSKFGNITSLDEKALEALAVVMGGKIEDMATMGLGASNPEQVLASIIDAFNERANSGYNSVGQYVGEQQARRELYSYLLKVSPQIADIFATMQEEQHNINSLFRDQADTFENWKNAFPQKRGVDVPAQDNVLVTTSQQWNVLKETLNTIKETLARNLAPDILAILRRISDMRIGLSESQNEAKNQENKLANSVFIANANKQLEFLKGDNLTEAEKQRKKALEYYIKLAEKENNSTGNIGNIVPTEDEIVVKGLRLAQAELETDFMRSEDAYSPELRHIVDTYIPVSKLKAYEEQYKNDLSARAEDFANEQVQKAKDDRARTRDKMVASARERAKAKTKDKNSEYYVSFWNKQIKGLQSADVEQMALVEELYYDTWSKDKQELWDVTPVKDRRALAIGWGAMLRDPITGSWGGVKLPEAEALSFEQELKIRKLATSDYKFAFNEEQFYLSAYKNWEDILWKHLLNMLKESLVEQSTEGTPLYDLDVLQRKYGTNLERLAGVVEGDTWGSIVSKVSNEDGHYVHKIILDVNADGKTYNDIELASYITNRISDVGTVVKQATIKAGNVTIDAQGKPASTY